MSETVRIGIVGLGSVVRRPYMTLIKKLSEQGKAAATMVCDVDPTRGELMRDDFGIANFTTDYRELIASEDVDLVLITTSMDVHAEIAGAALRAGKHVLVEKPMATRLEEAAALVELARSAPGHLVCAPHVILSRTYQEIWRALKKGLVGKVHLARARYGWTGPWWGKWFYEAGGGALFDLGVYNVTSLTGWLGPVRRVTAMAGIAIPERVVDGERIRVETEDNFQILLDFGGACFGAVTTGFTMQKYRCPAIELYGGEGTIQMMGNDWAPEGYEIWRNELGAWQDYPESDPGWRWTDGLRHLVDCIRNGTRPIITPEHAYHVTEVMLKAMEASRSGMRQDVESDFPPLSFPLDIDRKPAHFTHDRSH